MQRAADHARRNAEAVEREMAEQALSAGERRQRLQADRERRRREHQERNAAAVRLEQERQVEEVRRKQEHRIKMRRPVEDKMLRPVENKGVTVLDRRAQPPSTEAFVVTFASPQAEALAVAQGLTAEFFRSRNLVPSSAMGYTVHDIRSLLKFDQLVKEEESRSMEQEDEEP